MAEVTKEALRAQLEAAMEDVAMAMAETVSFQERLSSVREATAKVWAMAELGEVPEWEMRVKAVKVS